MVSGLSGQPCCRARLKRAERGIDCTYVYQFFFFQAEDGIRDVAVTGVQTCALPISNPPGGMAIWTGANNTIARGTSVHWAVQAPAGLTIASVYIPHMYSSGIDDGQGDRKSVV